MITFKALDCKIVVIISGLALGHGPEPPIRENSQNVGGNKWYF